MIGIAVAVFVLQALVMSIDELHFHRARSLPLWERWGHPLDTLSLLACLSVTVLRAPDSRALTLFVALGVVSCLLVTKDEFVHARLCSPTEHWLHALLFLIHPLVLLAAAWLWFAGERALLGVQTALTAAFGIYQLAYWNLPWRRLLRAR
jgi:hypothetical protein